MMKKCILCSELPSGTILVCASSSLLLSLVTFVVLVRCAQMHACLVHVFAGIQATSQVQEMRKKGRLHWSMRMSFLRQVIRNQAFLVTKLTDFERNIATIMSAHDGIVRALSGHWFHLVHHAFWHKELIFFRVTRIVIWVVLYKVTDITTDKCNICFLWFLEQLLCVPRLCLMVLGLHHMMLNHTHQG